MTVKWVTGKLGAGKGLYCDYEMVKYYREGRRVVTNYPVDTHLLGPDSDNPVMVLPSHPRPQDLQALGRGCPDEEKEKFGAIFLDEAGTWLNSRTYGDKSRLALIDWFIHSRHLGWDVFIIVQNEEMIDKQIALATGEVLVVCKRSDRAQGVFRKLFKKLTSGKGSANGSTPQKKQSGLFRHRVIVETYFQRKSVRDKPFDKFSFFADWYFGIHDTNHIFEDGYESLTINGQLRRCDMRCMYSLLPGRTITQWYHANDPVIRKPVISKRRLLTVLFFGSGTFLSWYFLVAHKQPDTAPGQVQPVSSSPTAVSVSGVSGTTAQAVPSPPPLSTQWRLTGYLKSGTGQPRYVIRDNAGNVRYIASARPWDGVYSEILVDGERVTFWTGTDRAPGSQGGGESPLSTAAAPVLSALGMGDASH